MRKILQTTVFLASFVSITQSTFAQPPLWSNEHRVMPGEISATVKYAGAENSIFSKLDIKALQTLLRTVPMERADGKLMDGTPFSIPLPGGEMLETSILESPIFSNKEMVTGIKTYMLFNPKTKSLDGRITVTPEGISGILFTNDGTVYIHPLQKDNSTFHIIYRPKDVKVADGAACISTDTRNADENGSVANRTNAGDGKRRLFRLAVAATGEYTTWAGSQANALTHITISVNNVAAIFERDLNIRFSLVTDNSIIFTNGNTDPYPGPTVPNWQIPASDANQTAMDNIFGTNNYDVSIVFNNGWGAGYAPTGAVCIPGQKGKCAAGINNGSGLNPTAGPQGFVFDFTVAHELGHMFGAAHTFASNAGFCGPYGNFATAYEPGAGNTLMSYAPFNTCGAYVNYNEPYFHAGSIAQMQSYILSTSCAAIVPDNNTAPEVTIASTSYNLPVSTPFTLTANGYDADGNSLIYNWEQMDAAFTATPPPGTNTTGSNFRSYAPTASGNIRTFPRMQDIAAGINTPYEKLTSVSRTMNFRITARDQAAGGGKSTEANVALSFSNSAGPFTVTSQSSPITWVANGSNTQTITWNVASTNAAPINCTAVDILFSVNGGITYPYMLAANTANDGSEVITVPNLPTQNGRIKVQPVNNVFFNINAANITVTSGCAAEGSTIAPANDVAASAGSALLNLSLSPQYGNVLSISGTINSGNPSTLLPIYNDAIPSCGVYGFTGSFLYNVHPFVVSTPGTFSFNIPTPYGLVYNIYRDTFNPAFPCTNFMSSNTVTGNNPTVINPNTVAALVPGNRYVLVVGTFSATFPALPANYTVSVSGGSIYNNPLSPGAGFNYQYVVVDDATNIIKSIGATANLSNAITYPGGTSYTVHGLSYSNTSPSLAGFVGGNYNLLTDALLFNATYCGNVSKNFVKAAVITQYTFTGNGNWSDASNWSNNTKPPATLNNTMEIVINPAGECILDVPVIFPPGVKLTVSGGKVLRVL